MGDKILNDCAAACRAKHVMLRYFNACGADPDGETGEWPGPEIHVKPMALKVAADAEPPFRLLEKYIPSGPSPNMNKI